MVFERCPFAVLFISGSRIKMFVLIKYFSVFYWNKYNPLVVKHLLNLIHHIMKKQLLYLVSATMLIFSACTSLDTGEVFSDEVALKKAGVPLNFRAHLTGSQEVPEVSTTATGQAVFQLSKDGTQLSYKLIVANIENVTQAHIHLAPAGVNGGVVAWLYPDGPPSQLIPGKSNGVLAEGIITGADLVGGLAGQPLSALVEKMQEGGTYVNVHTSAFPPGEIRGQISGNN